LKIYSRFPFFQLTQDWAGVKLSNIPVYHMVPILT